MPKSVEQILQDMEKKLIESYNKNISKGVNDTSAWQKNKIASLKRYKKESALIVGDSFRQVKSISNKQITASYMAGDSAVKSLLSKVDIADSFSTINTKKLDTILNEVNGIYAKAANSSYLYANNQYKNILKESQIYLDSGVNTLSESIDKAAKDFLSNGISSIKYKNGANVNVASYSEMVLRTNAKRAHLTGEGQRANEFGIYTVQVSSYGMCSDTCLPWQGQVYIDDVYADGKSGDYPLLSSAMENGLYHPNCRHTHGIWFEGISTLPPAPDDKRTLDRYKQEQRQRAIERNIRKYKNLEQGCVDVTNKAKYHRKVLDWQKLQREHLSKNTYLRRSYRRERIYGIDQKIGKPIEDKVFKQAVGKELGTKPLLNLLGDPTKESRSFVELVEKSYQQAGGDAGEDMIMKAINKQQGYDGLPKILDKSVIDVFADDDNYVELFRGVKGAQFTEQFKTGEFYAGKGIYGNGTYTALDDLVAFGYADRKNENLTRMVFDKNTTKVIEYKEAYRESIIESRKLFDIPSMDTEDIEESAFLFADDLIGAIRSNDKEAIRNIKINSQYMMATYSEPGKWALLNGYDAIYVEDAQYYVILNRTSIIVQR